MSLKLKTTTLLTGIVVRCDDDDTLFENCSAIDCGDNHRVCCECGEWSVDPTEFTTTDDDEIVCLTCEAANRE